jgi:putative ABC transport system permease protein
MPKKTHRQENRMRLIDIFRISIRMLRTNLLRSLLTIFGIGVAVSLIVLLIGLGYGLQNITIGSIIQSKSLLSLDITPAAESVPLNPEGVEAIQKTPGISAATPVIITTGEVRVGDKLASTAVTAAYPNYLEMEGITVPKGSAYKEDESAIVISPELVTLLDSTAETLLNQSITLTYTNPTNQNESLKLEHVVIKGISDTETAVAVYAPFRLINQTGELKIASVKAVAQNRTALITARDTLTKQGYAVETLIETLDQARKVFRWVTFALALFGSIALVVAAIGMFNTLTISLLERTREIGIMKALGLTNKAVKRLFLAEAALLGGLGGIAGICIGLLIDGIISLIVNQIAVRFGGAGLNLFQYPPGFLLFMILFPAGLALITGLYPANRAALLNPLKALRYE